jgi:WD40 repeat protein/tRNA A-37 threonylcarbamoyl transferase component Bud32
MPDSTDPKPTGEFPPGSPADHAETRDAPPPAEPGTATDLTHSHDRDPGTLTADPKTGAAPAEPLAVVPGYDILRELGSGGMGVVYEARQTRLNRKVALKVLRGGRGDAKDVIRFLAEAEAVAAVKHPHVVQVFDFGQDAGRPFLALELLTGGSLADRLKDKGRLDPRDAGALVAKLADAVRAIHELGIVHRDLKPGNVLFDEVGTPKIADFGLVKRAGGAELTHTQAVLGTPAYMAPEQARGETKFVGPSADVWALGAILYECLTGKRAFDADDTWAILRKVTDDAPPRPRSHVPGLPRDLELIALKCLEKNPADRYPSAAALADDLERFLAGQPVSVRPAGPVERFVKWVRRNPVVAGATAAVALALVAGTAVSLAFGLEARERGRDLAKANDDLTKVNDDLTRSRDDLMKSRNDLDASMQDVKRAQGDAEERGYLSDVALAHQLWKANDLAGMRAALARCPANRRKWEWHHLDRVSRPERAEHVTDSPPLALAYSPDGKFLAYTTFVGTLTVIDVGTNQARHTILGPPDPSNRTASVAFHPNSSELAYIRSGRVRVVDLATGNGKELTDPKQPDGNPGNLTGVPTIAVGYTPEGTLLAAAIGNGKKPNTREIVVRDAVAGKPVSTFVAVEQPPDAWAEVACAAFSPDAKRLAVSVVDSGVRVRGRDEPGKADLAIPARALAWEVESGKRLGAAEAGGNLLAGVAFDPAGAAVGFGRRGAAGAFEAKPGAPARAFAGHTGDVTAVAFDRTGLIWSGGEDKMILAHDRKTGGERFTLRGCTRTVLRLAVSPDGKEVAAAAGDLPGLGGAVYRFDVSAMAADDWRSEPAPGRITVVGALAPDGSRFAACGFVPFDSRPESFKFVTRDLATGKERTVTPAGLWVRGAFAPDGRLFVPEREKPADRAERLRVIDPEGKPSPLVTLLEDDSGHHATAVACTPDGRTLAAVTAGTVGQTKLLARLLAADTGTLKVRELGTADVGDLLPPKARFPSLLPLGLAFDRDGKRLAATFAASWEAEGQSRFESRGVLLVWDATTGKELLRKQTAPPLYAAAFDAQGRVAAAGGSPAGGLVFGWDVGTGAQWLSLRGHTRPILGLAFGPDDRLATAGADRLVKLWDVASKREVLTFDGFAREVQHVAFTAGGKNLVAGTGLDMLAVSSAAGVPTDWPPAEVRVFRGPK